MANNKIVSFEDELLIVVDEADNVLGYKSKAECHDGSGILHRAFSIFIFNENMEMLIQKRATSKRLWPLIWSNSCCSHPRKDEDMLEATQRRLQEEMGISAPLTFLFKFQYFARYKDLGSEKELCYVFAGKSNDSVAPNPNEIDEWRFISLDELEKELKQKPEMYSPWFKLEWERIKKDHLRQIEKL